MEVSLLRDFAGTDTVTFSGIDRIDWRYQATAVDSDGGPGGAGPRTWACGGQVVRKIDRRRRRQRSRLGRQPGAASNTRAAPAGADARASRPAFRSSRAWARRLLKRGRTGRSLCTASGTSAPFTDRGRQYEDLHPCPCRRIGRCSGPARDGRRDARRQVAATHSTTRSQS